MILISEPQSFSYLEAITAWRSGLRWICIVVFTIIFICSFQDRSHYAVLITKPFEGNLHQLLTCTGRRSKRGREGALTSLPSPLPGCSLPIPLLLLHVWRNKENGRLEDFLSSIPLQKRTLRVSTTLVSFVMLSRFVAYITYLSFWQKARYSCTRLSKMFMK